MRKFTNPLDNIHVASPCSANWDEMFGNEQKRHCGDCKMNVYNLSNMTRQDAENLLINSEGRLCVRFFRRSDGTILTKNCPVGWQAAKQRVSRVASAAFSIVAGFFGGVFAFNLLKPSQTYTMGTIPAPIITQLPINSDLPQMGEIEDYSEVMGDVSPRDTSIGDGDFVNGRVTMGKPVIVIKRKMTRK